MTDSAGAGSVSIANVHINIKWRKISYSFVDITDQGSHLLSDFPAPIPTPQNAKDPMQVFQIRLAPRSLPAGMHVRATLPRRQAKIARSLPEDWLNRLWSTVICRHIKRL